MPALVLGIGTTPLPRAGQGAKASLEGAGLAMAILLPFVIDARAGSRRLEVDGRRRSFAGPGACFLLALLASIFVSGLMAMVHLVRHRTVMTTLRNLVVLVRGFFSFGFRSHP